LAAVLISACRDAVKINGTVFVLVMENKNWMEVKDNPAAPYINGVLLQAGAHAEQYYNPPKNHPSEPNYIWLEAGDSLGIMDDMDPSVNAVSTSDHLVAYLERASITWKAYQEDIDGVGCPLTKVAMYAPKHDPFVFFDDVTGNDSPRDPSCESHIRPYSELAGDLQRQSVARYNFITPNLCHDSHDCGLAAGDSWLQLNVPTIMASAAYTNGGVLFIIWDEGEGSDGPIGLIVLSPNARPGFGNQVHYDHSSLLKTVQEILDVYPLLRHAGDPDTNDLSGLFWTFP
jgi:phosphatidylinositol-3-phosphatase